MAGGLPPLQLSSGPAVSGAEGVGGSAQTGAMEFNRKPSWQENVAKFAPLAIGAIILWALLKKKRK
jgi:hypothetical protein